MIGPVRECVYEFDDHTDADDHSHCAMILDQMSGSVIEDYWETNLNSTSYIAYLNRGY